jgi:hypothetical protein
MQLPNNHQRIRALKPFEYAREAFRVGDVLVLDTESALRLIRSKHAEAVAPEPERTMIHTSCPKCGSAMEYAAQPDQHERWTTCGNPACRHGWLR